MAELDTSKGWCCDGRTWHEHAGEDGHCCQPEGMQIEDLPEDGQEKAKERLEKERAPAASHGVRAIGAIIALNA